MTPQCTCSQPNRSKKLSFLKTKLRVCNELLMVGGKGRHGGFMVSALDSGSGGLSSSPGRGHGVLCS